MNGFDFFGARPQIIFEAVSQGDYYVIRATTFTESGEMRRSTFWPKDREITMYELTSRCHGLAYDLLDDLRNYYGN